ncbi:MAG: WYL domain-containing protein, partial [Anaerolineales bacterium]|nr:WYL domain-containing protein [Anaerolineales bacterium]
GRFLRPASFDLSVYWQKWCARLEATRERYVVTLHASPAGLPLLVQVFGEGMHALIANAGAPDDAGFLMLSLSFASEDEACRQLLGLGTAVTVIAPHSLRQCMAAAAVQISTLYA